MRLTQSGRFEPPASELLGSRRTLVPAWLVASVRGHALKVVLVLTALAALPALKVGWVHDDALHKAMLTHAPAGMERSPTDAYCFTGGPKDYAPAPWGPWWATPDLRACFFRPLASLLLWVDHVALGHAPLLAHAVGIAWFALLCGAVYALALRLFDREVATLALAIYGLSSCTGGALAWVASQHVLVSAALSAIGLVLYVDAGERGHGGRAALGLASVALALLGGEGALGGFGLVLAYELFRAREPLARRACWAGAAALLALAYVASYAALGFGANAGGYVEPTHHPGAFLAALPGRLLALAAEAVLGAPSDAWLLPGARPWLALLGVLALALVVALDRVGRVDRDTRTKLRFLVVGSIAALIPAAAAAVGGRLLILPGVGLSIALAARLRLALAHVRLHGYGLRGLGRFALALLGLGVFVLNPVMHVGHALNLGQMAERERLLGTSTLAGCGGARRLFVLGSDELTVALFAPYLLADAIAGRPFHQLTLARGDLALERLGPRTLRIQAEGGLAVGGLYYAFVRGSAGPLVEGASVALGDATVRVEAAGEEGVRALRVELSHPADDGSVCWLRYDGERLVRAALPAVGTRSVLRYVAGPMSY